MRRLLLSAGFVLGGWTGLAAAPEARQPAPPALTFADLPGWRDDDAARTLLAFRRTCPGQTPICRAARRAADARGEAPRLFFETWFDPVEISAQGFLTGYFEPEVTGSLQPSPTHPTPLLSKPSGLVMKPEAAPAGWPEGVVAARRTAKGYEALPDRAAIEAGALGDAVQPLVYVDPVDAFMIHVQGSARIRFADGQVLRVGFDGKNGHPYTAIGKVLAEAEGIPPAEMTADRLWAWLKTHPERAPAIMQANRSFIFFRMTKTEPTDGPVGGAGTPLVAGGSLAVDRAAWPYGTPVWLEGELPQPSGGTAPLRRLAIAQDTGTAIVGTARGDLFFGSGDAAGASASLVRHSVRWVVLKRKPAPARKRRR